MNQKLLVDTFNENITYLEQYQPKVFSKLLALDNAVVNGHYQEKYELTFDNNYFDVLEKATNNHLYTKNSNEYASLAASSIDNSLENNLFICSSNHEITDVNSKDYIDGITSIVNYIQVRTALSDKIKDIKKFIFFGVGLGLHIESIHKKIKACQYLIIEDDLELFRLSLFTINYKKLSLEAKLFFSIFEESEEFLNISEEFLKENYQYNKYIKYFEMLSHSVNKREEFHVSVTSQSHLRFLHTSMLSQNLLPLNYLSDSYQFMNKDITLASSGLENKPFLLIGAGPSLEKNIKQLKEKAKYFVIVAVSATLILLEKEKIVPDIVVHLDAFDVAIKHFDALKSLNFIKDSICFFSAKVAPLITLRLDMKNIYFFEDSTKYKENSFRPSSPCVGTISYQILLYLKVKNIYLLGLDLAVDSKTGKTHSDFHIYVKELDITNNQKNKETIEYKKNLLTIDGNKESTVLTTPHFKTSIDMLNYSTTMLKQDFQKVINFSDGAKFIDIQAKEFENFDTKEVVENVKSQLEKAFKNTISTKLTTKEKHSIKNKLLYAKYIRELLIKYYNLKVLNDAGYKYKLTSLVKDILKEDNDLSRAIDIYFRYLLPYIFDFLNKENINLKQEDYEHIDEMIVTYLLSIN